MTKPPAALAAAFAASHEKPFGRDTANGCCQHLQDICTGCGESPGAAMEGGMQTFAAVVNSLPLIVKKQTYKLTFGSIIQNSNKKNLP
ncbi:hypothetical protein [Thioclava sp.]|uniref:hypothetical protein n=1 Tax=Thioclava sp. TaxID=1933450 RepID=UPI003AA85F24